MATGTDVGAIRYIIEADYTQLQFAGEALEEYAYKSEEATNANRSFRVGMDTVSAQAARAAKNVKSASNAMASASKRTGHAAKASKAAASGFIGMRGAAQQVGYQLQDTAVQLQMGTNAFMVLGQQGSQVAGIFGPGGAVFGAVLAISAAIAGSLIPVLRGARISADELYDKIEELSGGFEDLTESQRAFILLNIQEEMDKVEKGMRGAREEIEELNADLQENIRITESKARRDQDLQAQARAQIDGQRKELVKLNAEYDTQQQELDALSERYEMVNGVRSRSSEEIEKEQQKLEEFISKLEEEAEALRMSAREQALRQVQMMNGTAAEVERVNAVFDSIDAYEAEQEALKASEEMHKQRLKSIALEIQEEQKLQEQRNRSIENQLASVESDVGNLVGDLMTPEQQEEQRYQEQLATLEAAQDQELAIIGGYESAKEKLEEEHQQRLHKIRGEAWDKSLWQLTSGQEAVLGASQTMFGQLADIAKAGGKDSFEAYKQMASAEALVAGALATMKALASAPPPFNFILAATTATLTAVQIAQIQNQKYEGARAMGGQVQGGGTYLVGEKGPELLTMGAGAQGHVTPNHKMAKAEGMTVQNVFQISTGVAGTVRAELNRMVPYITEQSKRSVIAAMYEGGAASKAVRRRT